MRPMLTASPYEMVSVDLACATIVELAPVLTTGQVSPWTAEGRVLAQDVRADGPLPAEPRSAVDGYAVRATDRGARRLLGEITAGTAGRLVIGPGDAARIMTGGVVPDGADAVIMVEDTHEEDGHVLSRREPAPGANVHPIGTDLDGGQIVVDAGTILGPAEIGLLATLGVASVAVYRRPRVAVLATGDELVEPWETPPLGCIRDSNRYALIAAVREAGGEVVWHGVARDAEDQLASQVNQALGSADVLITLLKMGGRSTIHRPRVEVEVEHEIRPDQARPEYQRAVVRWRGGRLLARTTGSQGSSRLLSMQGANALLEIAPADHPLPAGQRVPALLTGPIRNE